MWREGASGLHGRERDRHERDNNMEGDDVQEAPEGSDAHWAITFRWWKGCTPLSGVLGVIPGQMIRPESLDYGVHRWFCDGHGLQTVRRSPENGEPRITGWTIHEISGSGAQTSRGFETSLEDKNKGHTVGMRRVEE